MVTFASLRTLAQAQDNDEILRAIDYAEMNAADTIHVERGAADSEFDAIALASICQTSPFNESATVRAWFEAAGYRW